MVGVTAPSFVGESVYACAVHSLVACSLLSPPSLLSSLCPLSRPSLTISPLSHSLSSRARAHALSHSLLSLSPPLSLTFLSYLCPFRSPPTSSLLSLSLSLSLLSLSFLSLYPSPPPHSLSLPPFFPPTGPTIPAYVKGKVKEIRRAYTSRRDRRIEEAIS